MEKHKGQYSLVGTWLAVVVLTLLLGIMAAPCGAQEFRLNIGAGLGIPYSGVAGAMVEPEIMLSDTFSLAPSLAAGHTILADFGWDAGIKGLFLAKKGVFRPGFAVFYGTNLLLEDQWGDWDSKQGFSYGVMGRFQFGASRKHCLDVYVLYPTTDFDKSRYTEEGPSVKLGIGYTLHLN